MNKNIIKEIRKVVSNTEFLAKISCTDCLQLVVDKLPIKLDYFEKKIGCKIERIPKIQNNCARCNKLIN